MNPNIINTTTLLSYSSSEGGPNFIPSGVTDTARVTPATPALTKTLKATSEAHTSDVSNPPRAAIGEIVRYRMSITLPEGSFTNFQIDDNLPGGLVYMDDGTARVAFISNGAGLSSADAGALPVPAIPGACLVNGNETTAIPDPLPCALADFNVGIDTSIATDTDTQVSYTTGLDPQFKLGTLTNADTDADRELIIVEFNALVDNSTGGNNDAGNNRLNTFQLNVNGAAYGAVSAPITVRISEPSITNLTKVVNPTSADAGNTVAYTVTFSNANNANSTTAFDVNLTDIVPAKMTLDLLSLTTSYLPAACSSLASNTSAGNNINLFFTTIPVACQVTVSYQATLLNTVIPGEALVNAANIIYTSLPGTNGTLGNPTGTNTPGIPGANDGERIGSGVPVQNDYFDSSTAQVNVTQTLPVKSIVSTTQAHTSETGDGSVGNERDLAIGEIIRYRLTVTIPEGTIPDLQLRDTLPAGFTFLNDGDIRISFLANNPITTEADLTGADNDALPPTFILPIDRIVVAGQDVTFTVASPATAGDLINNDSDADSEYVVIDFNVRVNNDANNNNTDIDNNDFDIVVGGVTVATSLPVGTRIVEPVLNVAKSADDSAWIYGQTVTFTLTLTHEAASLSDAFDIVVTDIIPTGLTYLGGISAPAGWTTDATAAPTLTWTCSTANGCSLPLAGSAALTYQVTVDSPPDPNALLGDATATNTASMIWTSLPGDNNPGNPAGERNDVDGIGGVNDYTDSGSQIGGLENYYALGNRVWFDTNNNSQIDLAEVGVNGVLVNLYSASDLTAIIGTVTTSGGGYYLFDFLPAGDYVVAVAASNFADTAVLDTYWSSATTMDGTGLISETAAPDADITPADSDDNGTLQNGGTLAGAVVALPVTLGPGATEPTGETDLDGGTQGAQPDGRANMTVDFGFYRTGIGNLVWLDDVTVNGAYDNGETLVNNAPVSLYAADGTTAIPVGPDGALGTSDDAAVGITTNASGVYSFSGLPQGDYIVRAVGPAGTISTTDAFDSIDTSNPNTNADHNDNGIGITSNSVSAATLTMTPGSAGALTNNIVSNATGTTGNPTVDFGFVYPYALGNRIWFDTNNNSQIDFANEVGVDGVTVDLYAADVAGNPSGPVIATDTTTNGGYYLFDNLIPGDYVVVLPASNFSGAGMLTGYWSSATSRAADGTISETTAALAETDTDSDDNGTRQTSGGFADAVISSAVTLGPIGLVEPANESDLETGMGQGVQPDGRANMTVDFGFYRVEVGNLVFGDLNKNGTYDAGDTLFNGIAVQLYAENGTTEILVGPDGKLGTADDAAGGMLTDASGNYLFTGLPQGSYIIRTTAPTGTASTIDSYDQADNDNPTAENTDNNDNGDGTSNGVVSSAVITLNAGSAGAKNNNIITDANGTTTNPTMDFGFSLAYALGNRVWFDTNNNSQIDYATEVGVDGVVVDLYLASDLTTAIYTDTTTGGGYYLFNNLDAGDYVVVIPASNFASTATLEGYWSSGTTRNNNGSLAEAIAPDADLSTSDVDDNGMLQNSGTFSGAVVAQAVTIGPGGVEPTGETDLEGGAGQGQPDAQANMTVDFGFYTIQMGNLVWDDANVQD
ncbi:MAG: hypothetical protein HY863_15950, partial [Chloroflexi bacterium]|nr:hypothetical protein [Chloroflexota bacterium]